MKEKVVCYGSCIRPKFWEEMWKYFTDTNDVEFEMLMVGHTKPGFELPDNLHHVFSEEEPAACVEIGRRLAHASGCKYMLDFTDDYCKFSPHFLDKLIEDVENAESDGYTNYLTCAVFYMTPDPPLNTFDTPLLYHNSDPNSPQLHTWVFSTVATDKRLGSIDKRFFGQYWDVDLQMRNYELGGVGGQQKSVTMTERPPEPSALAKRGAQRHPNDRQILDSFWTPIQNGVRDSKNRYMYGQKFGQLLFPTTRKQAVQEYTDDDLNYLQDNTLASWEDFWVRSKDDPLRYRPPEPESVPSTSINVGFIKPGKQK